VPLGGLFLYVCVWMDGWMDGCINVLQQMKSTYCVIRFQVPAALVSMPGF